MSGSTPLRHWLLLQAIAAGNGEATIPSLREQFQLGDKMLRRDLELLRKVGFPILERTGKNGRKSYSLDDSAVPPMQLCYDEALALYIYSAPSLDGAGLGDAAGRALAKIESALGGKVRRFLEKMRPRIHRSRSGGDYAAKKHLMEEIRFAIDENRKTLITYRSNRSTEPVTYYICPYFLHEHRDSWYIIGLSDQHGEIRTWKVDRLEDAEASPVAFQRPKDFDPQEYLAGGIGVFTGKDRTLVRIRFTPEAARYAGERKMNPSQKMQFNADGSAICEMRLGSLTEVKAWIMSFGASAEVLAPPGLRQENRGLIEAPSQRQVNEAPPAEPSAVKNRGLIEAWRDTGDSSMS